MLRRWLAFAVAAATCGACYFTTTLDGLSRGDALPGPGAEAGDATITDATAPVADAVQDAATASCGDATFCDDFEDRDAAKGSWSEVGFETGSSLTITTARAHSGHAALRASLAPGKETSASLSKTFANGSRVEVRVSFVVDGPTNRFAVVNALYFTYPTYTNGVYFGITGKTLQVLEAQFVNDVPSVEALTSTPFTVGEWQDIQLVVDRGASPAKVTAFLGGEKVLDTALKRTYAPGPIEVAQGVDYADVGDALLVDFDDVRIDVSP